MNPSVFRHAVRLLAHPLSLAALALMLANDFIFKALWPSWWTGKLSDFAGLFFGPFLLAALLGLVLPARWGRRAGLWAFGLSGAGFAALKLSPALNTALLGAFYNLSGIQLQARPDPSDLLALFSLLPAAWLWGAEPNGRQGRLGWERRLLVLPLAALVTLADAMAPDLGVICLQAEAAGVRATIGYRTGAFLSQDGGLSWQRQPAVEISGCQAGSELPAALSDPTSGDLFRFKRGEGIERSADGGLTWQEDFRFNSSEADRTFFELSRGSSLSWGQLPYAALVDPASGNIILAMGLEGTLVHPPGGGWRWAAVENYQHDSLRQAGMGGLLFLLQSHLVLALLAALGWFYTRAARLLGKYRFWVFLGWIALFAVSFLVSPAILTGGYINILPTLGLGLFAIVLLIVLVVAAANLKGRLPGLLLQSLPQMGLVFLACLLPYVLWGAQVLPEYTYAFLASNGLVGVLLFVLKR